MFNKNILLFLLINFYIIVLIIIVLITTSKIIKISNIKKQTDNLIQVIATDTGYLIQNKKEKYKNSDIDKYYPVTKYDVLNKETNKITDNIIQKFKEEVKDDRNYRLIINFDYYETKTHISIVFHTFVDLALAHPMVYVDTINYNKKENKIETIDKYINEDKNFLKNVSKSVYDDLSKQQIYKDEDLKKYLKEALSNYKEIFSDYIVEEEGITFIFETYKVAPYVYGELQSFVEIK